MDSVCQIQKTLSDPYLFFWAFAFICFATVSYVYFLFYRRNKKLWRLVTFGLFCFLFFLVTVFAGTLFLVFSGIIPLDDSRPSSVFHQMNAAIKNTCYLDPLQNNCPHNMDEVFKLYPEDFIPLKEKYVFTYQYVGSDNSYTLIARPKNIRMFWNRVAIFDPRLPEPETNYDTPGLDFADAKAFKCGDRYHLESPPPFDGPWKQIN